MRAALVLVLVFVLAGCPTQPAGSGGSGYDEFGCKQSCDKCPSQTLCIGAPYVPVCLVQCRVTTDCDQGICIVVGSPIGPGVCQGALTLCDPPTACTLTAQCRDANTALKPLSTATGLCAFEVVSCDSGCDSATGSCK
jgi:hypothetical protein